MSKQGSLDYTSRWPLPRDAGFIHTPLPSYRCLFWSSVGWGEGYRARPARFVPGELPAGRLRQSGGAQRAGVLLLFKVRCEVLLSRVPGTTPIPTPTSLSRSLALSIPSSPPLVSQTHMHRSNRLLTGRWGACLSSKARVLVTYVTSLPYHRCLAACVPML